MDIHKSGEKSSIELDAAGLNERVLQNPERALTGVYLAELDLTKNELNWTDVIWTR